MLREGPKGQRNPTASFALGEWVLNFVIESWKQTIDQPLRSMISKGVCTYD